MRRSVIRFRPMTRRRAAAIALALAAAACQPAKPFEPTPSSEIQPGAGLFSGPEGRFVIYDGMAYCSEPSSALCQRTPEGPFTPKN